MKENIQKYIDSINDFYELTKPEQVDLFCYFLEEIEHYSGYKPNDVSKCFESARLDSYSSISTYLSRNTKGKRGKPVKYLKSKTGHYQLNSPFKLELNIIASQSTPKSKTSNTLRDLLNTIKNAEQNQFLEEAINCYEIEAYRASIVMVWNLTMDHLFEFILVKKNTEFNSVLSTNSDRRIRISSISIKDDFSEIPEGKFIEFCKQARIISKDVRKILDEKLGIRNTYAHPSNVILAESKAIEFIEDLVYNVIHKYKR